MTTPPRQDEFYRAVFENHPAIKLLIDPSDGAIVDANHAACTFYGYTRGEMCRLSIHEINQLPQGQVDAHMKSARGKRTVHFVFPHRLASGEVRTVEVDSGPVECEGKTYLLSVIHDMTTQKRLRDELDRFFKLSESLMGVVGKDERLVRFNPALEHLLGHPPREIEDRRVLDFVHPDDRVATAAEIEQRRNEGGASRNFVCRLVRRDGEVRTTSWMASWDPVQHVLYIVGRDITAERAARVALEASETRYRALVENIEHAIFQLDPDGVYQFINRAGARVFGRKPADVIGRSMTDVLSADGAAGPLEMLATVVSSARSLAREHPLLIGGDERTYSTSLVPVLTKSGRVGAVIGIGQDVTVARRAEIELRASRAAMHLAQQVGHFGSWDWVLGTPEAVWSDEVYRIFGMEPPPGGARITIDSYMERVHRDDRAAVATAMRAVERDGEPFDMEYRLLRPDGCERTVYSRGRVFEPPAVDRPRVIGMVLDITDRKLREEERERLVAELQNALAHVKTLHGLLPICCACKKIRDDKGYWEQIEVYVKERSDAEFTHGLCPECMHRLYPEYELPDNKTQ